MKITDLKPADYNPRTITDEQLKRLKKSLKEYGDLSGIIYNCHTGNLVGGHQRIKCLPDDAKITKKDLPKITRTGTVAVGIITIDGESYAYREVDWTLDREKAANIAANQHGGEFDESLLAPLLKELSSVESFDNDLIGFEPSILKNLIASIPNNSGPENVDPDDVPDLPPVFITNPGDIYILGNHRLLCGDATKAEDVEKLMDGQEVDMVYSDPPYGISIVDSKTHKIGAGNLAKNQEYREVIGDDTISTAKAFYDLCITMGMHNIILWGGNYFTEFLPPTSCWIIWDKRGDMNSNNFADGEIAWSNKKYPMRIYKQIWNGIIREGESDKRIHPTQKPIALAEYCLDELKADKIIFDGFLGSGSTLIACEKTDRICYGMEIDPHYCDVIVKRWEDFTGQKAERISA